MWLTQSACTFVLYSVLRGDSSFVDAKVMRFIVRLSLIELIENACEPSGPDGGKHSARQ